MICSVHFYGRGTLYSLLIMIHITIIIITTTEYFPSQSKIFQVFLNDTITSKCRHMNWSNSALSLSRAGWCRIKEGIVGKGGELFISVHLACSYLLLWLMLVIGVSGILEGLFMNGICCNHRRRSFASPSSPPLLESHSKSKFSSSTNDAPRLKGTWSDNMAICYWVASEKTDVIKLDKEYE